MGGRGSKLSKIVVEVSRLKGLRGPPPPPPPPPQVLTPKGYIPVSVGKDNKRFMVHTRALGDADFLELLCRSAEEYGFYNDGVLRIPYEAEAFEQRMMINKPPKHKYFVRAPT